MINHLPNLTSLFIGSSVTDRSIRLAPTKITALLHAHPLLEELIFVRAFIDEEPDPSEITPHSLHKLKRLAFHRCESAAVRTIVSLIKHTHGLAILIDRISGWPKYIPSVKINRLITKSVPEGRSGYTDAFVSAFKRRSTRIGLSGPGVAYSIALPAEHGTDTADGVLSAMARSGHLARLERLWLLGLGYTTQSWLRSASNLSLLTIQCTRAMWYNSVWIQRLFQWLPSSLQELHILIHPSEDDANVTTNCETLLTLNDKRTKSLRIRLKVYKDPSRRDQIISIYEHCKNNEHVSVEPWSLAQMRRDLTEEHLRSQCDLLPQHHKYWPSWFEDTLGYCLVQNGVDDNMWFPY
ncbi:hypothetical protein QCA50_018684 [Cerrena zonata]|uniref:Uncharacterized protein n=1 Tax=Cerrena zonata TaxID=2478898 RepID=A0AAW0FCZ3_9APHY